MPLIYSLLTPERTVATGEADALIVPTTTGQITIFPGHIALSSLLAPGEMRVRSKGKEELFALSTGFLSFTNNTLTILADTAERSDELELVAIEKAKQEAEEAKKQVRFADDVSYAAAAAALERELVRYKVALKGKGKGRTITQGDER